MSLDEFLAKQIRAMLVASGKVDENQANAAVTFALEYRRTNPNATTEQVINKAKFYAKRNNRPATPERTEPIKKARLPAWRQPG
ncbi:hypothetical protein [Cedecea sp. MMO-103]|uniref:hypothetical protein n=1 Tax=Cedecea sp. MMO-103 TaxID=3081238 RepID=UPI003017A408